MAATVSITPTAPTDGIVYCTNVPIVPTEATLGDALLTPDPIPMIEGQTIVAIVKITVTGIIVAQSSFVFLQTDLGDGTWIDVAWAFFNGKQGTATFVLCGGGIGAMNNSFQQTRQASSAPSTQANGSNAVPLGGRVRFSGFSNFAGGSSSLSGIASSVKATITYKLQHPR